MKVTLRELRKPLRVCWHYAVDGVSQNALAGAAAADVASAVGDARELQVRHAAPDRGRARPARAPRPAPGVHRSACARPARVRRGQTIRLRLRAAADRQRQADDAHACACACRCRAPTGLRTLRLEGTPADSGGDPNEEGELSLVFEDEDGRRPTTPDRSRVAEVRDAFLGLERYDGVSVRLGDSEGPLFRDPRLRISGEARVQLRIR